MKSNQKYSGQIHSLTHLIGQMPTIRVYSTAFGVCAFLILSVIVCSFY